MTRAGAWLLARDIRKFNTSGDVACALFAGTDKSRILDRPGSRLQKYKLTRKGKNRLARAADGVRAGR